jgi:hypothetical protein
MEQDLTALTSAAAVTLVRLMAADSWDRAKGVVVSMWRRAHPLQADEIDAELAAARLEVLAAHDAQDEQAELDLVSEWRSRLRRLVAADPQVVQELRQLVEELRPILAEAEDTRVSSVRMQARASGQGRVYQAARDQKIGGP